MQKVIRLPNGQGCRLPIYCAAWRSLKTMHPDDEVCRWGDFPETAESVPREMRAGMHDRINRHLPWYDKGRKWSDEWQIVARRVAQAVNTPRLIVRRVPREFAGRLAHRLTTD